MSRIIDYVFMLKKKCLLEEHEIGNEVGLSPSEIHGIEAINRLERISGNSLSERMGLSPSRGSRVIDHLITKGLLFRAVDESDRRANVIGLTPKGDDIKKRIESAKRVCEAKITAHMKEEQIEQLKQSLDLLMEVL
jgi:DNA-binding MarR family transcriptional regulator